MVLCMVLTDSLLVNGLAIASAASSSVYALLLLVPLVREDKQLLSDGFVPDLVKMLLATLAMAAAAFAVWQGAAVLLPEGKLFLLVGLGLCAGAGAVVYFLCTWCLKLEEARLSADLVKRLLKRG